MARAGRMMLAALAALGLAGAARAECGGTHVVAEGETVFSVAERYYADHTRWSAIYYANQGRLGGQLFEVAPGTELSIPCLEEAAPGAAAEMVLLTGSDNAPFTDRDWPGQGMITEIVDAALAEMPEPVTYEIRWVAAEAQGLAERLEAGQGDMAFPVARPACEAGAGAAALCRGYLFSEPVIEMPVALFVATERRFDFDGDADLHGKVLCRPEGHFLHDLERPGRQWLTTGQVRVVLEEDRAACFDWLQRGRVDAVAVNQFLGLADIAALGLGDRVEALPRPLSIESLHVVIPRTHWRGTAFLYRFDAGLAALRASGRYDEIVNRHLDLFSEQIN